MKTVDKKASELNVDDVIVRGDMEFQISYIEIINDGPYFPDDDPRLYLIGCGPIEFQHGGSEYVEVKA